MSREGASCCCRRAIVLLEEGGQKRQYIIPTLGGSGVSTSSHWGSLRPAIHGCPGRLRVALVSLAGPPSCSALEQQPWETGSTGRSCPARVPRTSLPDAARVPGGSGQVMSGLV